MDRAFQRIRSLMLRGTFYSVPPITMQVNAGVHNIFNAYQSDFDRGAKRDSGYIYGPGMPRSYFAGVKLSF